MNSLLKLEFFKSIGFPTKESGMAFINENENLKKQIEEKVDEIDDVKYKIIDYIRDKIFPKYEEKKDIFILKVKGEQSAKIAHKKDLQKKALKEEMKEELLKEIKEEEEMEKKKKLIKNYPDAIPIIEKDIAEKFITIQDQFVKIMKMYDRGDIKQSELKNIEKMKDQVEKAFNVIEKVSKHLDKYVD